METEMDCMALRATWWHRTKRTLRGCRPQLSLRLCLFEEQFCIDLFGFLISLPFLDRWHREPHEIMESWGAYYRDAAMVWCWGEYTKFFHMPWQYDHIKREVMRPDGNWAPYVGSWELGKEIKNQDGVVVFQGGKEPDGRWQGTYPYHYLLLPSGEVQHAQATIYVYRQEWRRKWLRWCPMFSKTRQCIDVEFDREMGGEAGSWKGGVIGTGYEMRPGEEPVDTLRRMQREHRLDR